MIVYEIFRYLYGWLFYPPSSLSLYIPRSFLLPPSLPPIFLFPLHITFALFVSIAPSSKVLYYLL